MRAQCQHTRKEDHSPARTHLQKERGEGERIERMWVLNEVVLSCPSTPPPVACPHAVPSLLVCMHVYICHARNEGSGDTSVKV